MLVTKAVEGFIRLFGGVHFDESTHPLDGGLFGAIADLDCLNPKGGKAAERKRRKRGSKQLQANVSAVGSLTTQMMLDRHSLGVMRPSAPYATPGPSEPTSPNKDYFPTYAPPLGPPPMDRRSSDEPYGQGGNIMDAWRPAPVEQAGYFSPYQPGSNSNLQAQQHGRSQSTPLAWSPSPEISPQAPKQGPYANTGFSVIRGGRSDVQNPYTVQPGTGAERSLTMSPPPSFRVSPVSPKPTHSRQHSSTAIIENFDSRVSPPQTPLYPPTQSRRPSGLQQLGNQGLAPPVLAIPKRRSLNNLRADSPTDKNEAEKEAKKKKRRSWFKSGDLPSSDQDGEEEEISDDEPGPSRPKPKSRKSRKSSLPLERKEPAPFEPVPTYLDYDYETERPRTPKKSNPGWRGMLGLKRKESLDDIAEMARDENKARKAALAAESGAMLAGLPPPSSEGRSFKVARRPAAGADAKTAAGARAGSSTPTPSPSKSTKKPAPISISTSSLTPKGTETEAPKSFRVKRRGPSSPQKGIYEDIPLSSVPPPSSFKVTRPNDSPPPSSFIVNRPNATPPRSPVTSAGENTGRASPDIHVHTTKGKGKAAMFRPTSGTSPRL